MRGCCCCCINKPDERGVYHNSTLMVANDSPPTPSDINWTNYDLSTCGKVLRVSLSILIILLFLGVNSTIVGLCGVYISSHSNDCDSIDTSTYTASSAAATGDSTILRCYCNANLVASFTDD